MLICVVVTFNFLAFFYVQVLNLSRCLRRRRERIRSMEDRVVRLKPLPLEFEKSDDVTNAIDD
jgi:hypothetical protein